MHEPATLVDLDRTFRVDEHLVDPKRREVRLGKRVVSINPKELEVLREMARRPGKVISKEALLDAVWGETVVVEHALTNAVHRLRKAFGDTPRKPRIIRTVHRRGYELIASIAPAARGGTLGRNVAGLRSGAEAALDPSALGTRVRPGTRVQSRTGDAEARTGRQPLVRGRLLITALALVLVLLLPKTSGPSDVAPLAVSLAVVEVSAGPVTAAEIEAFGRMLVARASGLVLATASEERASHVIEARIRGHEVAVTSGRDQLVANVESWGASLFDCVLKLTLAHENRTIDYHRMRAMGTISTKVLELVEKGNRARDRSDLVLADHDYDKAFEIDPDDPTVLDRQAVFFQGQLEVAKALRFAELSQRNATRRGAHLTTGALRLARAAADQRRAEQLLRDVLADDPGRVDARYQLLWQVLFRRRDCAQALVLHQEIEATLARVAAGVGRAPMPGDYWWYVAIACVMCGDRGGALEALTAMEAALLEAGAEDAAVDDDTVATVHAVWMSFLALIGDRDQAEARLARIPRRPDRGVGSQGRSGGAHTALQVANAHFVLGDLDRAGRGYASARHGSLPRWSSLATQRLAMVRTLQARRSEARVLIESKILDLAGDAPSSRADVELADHLLPLRGLLGVVSLLDGDVDSARAELDRLLAVREARIARNGGPYPDGRRYNAYQEEWLHLLEGLMALEAQPPDETAARHAFDAMASIKPSADGPFMAFLSWLARDLPMLQQAAERVPFLPVPPIGS